MASTQQIRGRIKSVKNTRQITKAMQLVSASKLRRMQEAAAAAEVYSRYARELLTHLRAQDEAREFAFYTTKPVKNRLIIIITSDRGLAGAYNSNVLKTYVSELKNDRTAGVGNQTIVVGRQGANFVGRLQTEISGVYTNLPDKPALSDLQPAIQTAIKAFTDKEVEAVDVIYTHFISTINQKVTVQRLLPAGFTDEEVSDSIANAEFEPSIEAVLETVTIRLIEAQFLQGVLESFVSEQAMRMVAMKNATDNANDLVEDYTLELNNARQAAITQELAEISGGVEALND